jgi:hypothetical protein
MGSKSCFIFTIVTIKSVGTIEGKCIVHTFKDYTKLFFGKDLMSMLGEHGNLVKIQWIQWLLDIPFDHLQVDFVNLFPKTWNTIILC